MYSLEVLEFDSHVVVGDWQHGQSLVIDIAIIFWQEQLQKLILQQNYTQHWVLKCILMPIELTENRAQVKMSVSESFGIL